MKKLVIVGCGRLGGIVAEAVIKGILPEYDLVGVYSRTVSKAESMAARMQEQGKPCLACTTIADLLALKPDYLVEAASPAAMRELAIPTLKNGTSIVTLSIGALADDDFYLEVSETAKAHGTRVYDESLQTEQRTVFSGSATEAIKLFPTKVNVTVAASRASVGPGNMQVTMQSTPGFTGDTQRVEIRNDQVHAVIDVYSATAEIAGWSVVNTLLNITSPIVF